MNIVELFLFIIGIGLLLYGLYWLYHWLIRHQSAKLMNSFELNDQIRKTQVIDVRETPEFNSNHILGARNIPMSQFKLRFSEIRKDKPVCLYGSGMDAASRAAKILHKQGYSQVYVFQGGIEKWLGKVKSEL